MHKWFFISLSMSTYSCEMHGYTLFFFQSFKGGIQIEARSPWSGKRDNSTCKLHLLKLIDKHTKRTILVNCTYKSL